MQHSGTNPTKVQKQWFHDVGDICGCICCLLDGHPRDHSEQAHVSIHHCDGRTKAHAHYYVLPLCAGHHQPGTGNDKNMLAVHGNKSRFIEAYGREIELVDACVQLVERSGRVVPDGVHALLAKWYASQQYTDAQKAVA